MPDSASESVHSVKGDLASVNPLRSLPARISMTILGATLITTLAVTAISVQSIDSFLRGKIEQQFPIVLTSAEHQLDLWYEQRLLDLSVFSASRILVENLPLLQSNPSPARAERAIQEIEQYLSYVLEGFPQYGALYVIDDDSKHVLWVGSEYELSAEDSFGGDAIANKPRFGDAIRTPKGIVQIVSVGLQDDAANPIGTLRAVIRLDAVTEILGSGARASAGEVFLLDRSGNYLVASPSRIAAGPWVAPLFPLEQITNVASYLDGTGTRVVGCAMPLERFGWTLAIEEPYQEAFAPVVSAMQKNLKLNLAIVLLFSLLAFRIANSITRPIEALSAAALRISAGGKDVEIPESRGRDEVGIMTRTFNAMSRRLEHNARALEESYSETEQAVERMRQKNDELQRVNEILEQLSITDGLTKLHNHRYFQEYLEKEVKRAQRTNESLALILIDIDHFKKWNDRLGHSSGDAILQRIAEIMQAVTRQSDVLARYGGEEFALLLPNTDLQGAVLLAEKIRLAVGNERFFDESPGDWQPLTVSIGVSTFRLDKRSLFDDADQALYRAKAMGRDCVMAAETA